MTKHCLFTRLMIPFLKQIPTLYYSQYIESNLLNSTKLGFYWRIDATSNATSRIMSPYNLQISFHIWTLIQSKYVYYFHNARVNANQCLYNKISIDKMMLAKSSGHIFVGYTIWILGHNNYCFVVIFPEENKKTDVFSGKRVDLPTCWKSSKPQ